MRSREGNGVMAGGEAGERVFRPTTQLRHPELVSGSIALLDAEPRGEKWTLKRVQGDSEGGRGG